MASAGCAATGTARRGECPSNALSCRGFVAWVGAFSAKCICADGLYNRSGVC
jgi:hypothetical protein